MKKKPGVKPWELPDPTRRKLIEQPLAIHATYPHPGKTYPRNAKYGSHNCPGVVSDMGDNYLLVAALNTTLEQSMEIESVCSPVHPAFRRKNQAADLDMLWAVCTTYVYAMCTLTCNGGMPPIRQLLNYVLNSNNSPDVELLLILALFPFSLSLFLLFPCYTFRQNKQDISRLFARRLKECDVMLHSVT